MKAKKEKFTTLAWFHKHFSQSNEMCSVLHFLREKKARLTFPLT
jgi:hypothetical protein